MTKFGELACRLELQPSPPPELYNIDVRNADNFCYYRIKRFLEASDYEQILEDLKQVNKFNLPAYLSFEEDEKNNLHLYLLMEVD